jgi:hypothetical protein
MIAFLGSLFRFYLRKQDLPSVLGFRLWRKVLHCGSPANFIRLGRRAKTYHEPVDYLPPTATNIQLVGETGLEPFFSATHFAIQLTLLANCSTSKIATTLDYMSCGRRAKSCPNNLKITPAMQDYFLDGRGDRT